MSLRRETFCCLLLNCVAVSAMIVLLSISLHRPQPVIFIGVGNVLPAQAHPPPTPSHPSTQQVIMANSNEPIRDPTLIHSSLTPSHTLTPSNGYRGDLEPATVMDKAWPPEALSASTPLIHRYPRSRLKQLFIPKQDKNRAPTTRLPSESSQRPVDRLSTKHSEGVRLLSADSRPDTDRKDVLNSLAFEAKQRGIQSPEAKQRDIQLSNSHGKQLSNQLSSERKQPGALPKSSAEQRPSDPPGGQRPGDPPGGQRPGDPPGGQRPGNPPREQRPGDPPGGQRLGDPPGGQRLGDPLGQRPGDPPGGQRSGDSPGGQRPGDPPRGQRLGDPPGRQRPGDPLGQRPGDPPGGQKPSDPPGGQRPSDPPGGQRGVAGGNGTGVGVSVRQMRVVESTQEQFSSRHDVLPRVAFVDSRPRYTHTNATVMLVQVRDVKRQRYNRIVGCGVDHVRAAAHRVKPLFVYRNWIRSNVPNLTHSEAVVTCYDLPSRNGSRAFVLYRPYRAISLIKVYSERPVYVPSVSAMKPWSVVVCATVYDRPPWLSEWLRYQQTIGVDHIYLYAQQSFIDKGGMENVELQKLLSSGRLAVDVRKAYLNSSQVYYYSQPLHYQDCLLRFRGVYDFAMLIDTDDFFVPRVPGHTDIHFYLQRLFNTKTASVKLDWIRYFPSCGLTTPPDQILDGNVTDHLSTYRCYKEYVKSIHRLEYVSEAAVHEVTYLMPGYKKAMALNSTVYIAHIRKTDGCHDNEPAAVQVLKVSEYEEEGN